MNGSKKMMIDLIDKLVEYNISLICSGIYDSSNKIEAMATKSKTIDLLIILKFVT